MYSVGSPARAFSGYRIGVRYDCESPRAATRGPVERASIKLKNNFSRLPFPLTFHYLYIRQDASRDKKYLKQVSIFYSPLAFHYLFRRKDTSQHKNQASLIFCFRLSLSLHHGFAEGRKCRTSSGAAKGKLFVWINNTLRFCSKMQ